MMTHLALSLLGPFQVTLNQEPVTGFESNKVRALLAYLAVEADRPHRREALVGLLWPDWPERSARANLRNALAKLRRAIGDRAANPSFLLVTRDTVQFNRASDYWLDVQAFAERVEAASTHQPGIKRARHPLEEAVNLYRGPFLEGFALQDSAAFDDWSLLVRERLHRQALDALCRLAGHCEAAGELDRAVGFARRQLELEPWREEAHRQLMRLLALNRQRSLALAQYETCSRLLRDELGVQPAAETKRLYERVRDGELQLPERSHVWLAEHSVAVPDFLDKAAPFEAEAPLFVGRQRQLAQLEAYLDLALAGESRVVFVTGGPGRGKTALMDEFARRAMDAHPALLVASGSCNAYLGLGDPYLPFREVLGMLTGDVEARWAAGAITREHTRRLWSALPLAVRTLMDYGPHLIDIFVPGQALLSRIAAAAPDATQWHQRLSALVERQRSLRGDLDQGHLYEQVTNVLRTLGNEHPLLLIVDDVQWADTASIGLLFHLGRRLAASASRILILSAYRPEEVALGRDGERHPLEKVLNELKRHFGDVWVDLAQVGQAEGRQFVDAVLDSHPNRLGEAFRGALFRHTQGHPLFTVELVRAMQERGELVRDPTAQWVEGPALEWGTLPVRVGAVIGERIDRVEKTSRDILTIASVEGERFTAQVVAQVKGLPVRQVLQTLSHDLRTRHHLVQELGEAQVDHRFVSRYRFAHALYQQYLYENLAAGERRLLHWEIAAALEELYQGQTAEIAVELARHYAGNVERERHYARLSGERAAAQFANAEALRHLGRALDLTPATDRADRYDLLRVREKVFELRGEREHQLQDLTTLSELASALDDDHKRVEVALRQANYYVALSDYGAALEAVQQALAHAAQSPHRDIEIKAHIEWGRVLVRLGDFETSREALERALALARASNDQHGEAQGLYNLARVFVSQGEHRTAQKLYLQALQIYRQEENLRDQAYTLSNLGVTHYVLGDYLIARDHYAQALALFRAIGDRRGETMALTNLGIVYTDLGDLRMAQDYHRQACDIGRTIQDRWGETICLMGLGLIQHNLGDDEAARTYCEGALSIQREIGDREGEAYSLTYLGHVLVGLGQLEAAAASYDEALNLRRELGQYNLLVDDWAGLAHVAEAQGDLDQALERVEDILAWVEANLQEGIECALRVYLTCYRVLRAHHDPRARQVLATAHKRLQERAATIGDEELQRAFLENVTVHREIVSAWEGTRTRA